MKITRIELSNLIKEEYKRQINLSELKKQRNSIKKDLFKLNEEFDGESGYYAPGTEHDPNAPWNQEDPKMIDCWVCNGTGVDPEDGEPCYKCNGTGKIEDDGDNEGDGFDSFEPGEEN